MQRPSATRRIEGFVFNITRFVMHGTAVLCPVSGTGLAFKLQPVAMGAYNAIVAERLVVGICDSNVNIKVEVIGVVLGRFRNNKREIRRG